MNNKKGISAVVATVLIILITVAAVTIIWAAIIPLIQNQLGSTTACLDAQTEVNINSEFTCINDSKGNVSIQIKRGASEIDLSDIQIILHSGGSSNSTRLVLDNHTSIDGLPGANSARVYMIMNNTPGPNNAPNLTQILGLKVPDRVQIAPIVTSGNTEQVCPSSQIIDLRPC